MRTTDIRMAMDMGTTLIIMDTITDITDIMAMIMTMHVAIPTPAVPKRNMSIIILTIM